MFIQQLILAVFLAFIFHEGGHSVMSRVLAGTFIKFYFELGWLFGVIPIPRYVWTMPKTDKSKQRIIALSGFGLEFVACAPLFFLSLTFGLTYLAVCVAHILAYRFYAGDKSDFRWL